jgi:hypothetical protein
MWVTTRPTVELASSSSDSSTFTSFTHNLSHKIKGLNSPLTWGYTGFPQKTGLVTTTTYNYMKTPVRFLLSNFLITQLLKEKTCKVLLQREG